MHSPRYVVIEKQRGQTPLEAITAWRKAHPMFAEVRASYAGRLDPMAEGKLLVLLGDECRKQDRYIGLDKEYEVEFVLGIGTDTGDALGMPTLDSGSHTVLDMERTLSTLVGSHAIPYPAFSSKTVNGKPLFLYTLEGTLDTITIHTHDERIYRIKLLETSPLSPSDLTHRIDRALAVVPRSDEPSKVLGADFRQDAIRAAWKDVFADLSPDTCFGYVRLRVTCASGTYMRTLAERLGSERGTRGFALTIRRTKIGRYVPLGPWGVWWKQY